MDDLVRAGKVLYIGISDAPAWWIARANTMAEMRDWAPKMVVQIAHESGKSAAQAALNWLRAEPGVIPIVGARTSRLMVFDSKTG